MDQDEPKRVVSHDVGMVLDALSIEELEQRVGLLEEEISRLKKAITLKNASRSAADAVFKF